VLRVLLVALAWLWRRADTRLRWQLMLSQTVATVLTLMTLALIGSIAAVGVLLVSGQPGSDRLAPSLATQVAGLALVTGPAPHLDPQRGHLVLQGIENGRISTEEKGPLAALLPRYFAPTRVVLIDTKGRVVAQTAALRLSRPRPLLSDLTPADRSHLIDVALAGRPLMLREGEGAQLRIVAAAPIRTPQGVIAGAIVVEANRIDVSLALVIRAVAALFTFSTVVLVLIAALPVLGLSALGSYLPARRMTRNLEALSAVATSIAAGDLSRRAPIRSHDEVGRLAEDVNSMAEHLQQAMGEMAAAREQAERALRTRQELVANVSHELRTPLAVLRAHLESIEAHAPAHTVRTGEDTEVLVPPETLHALRAESERLERLVDDLFALSRAQEGRLEVQIAPVDVGSIVDEAVELFRPLARREGMIALSATVEPGLPPALADGARLEQILGNLLRNAVRHTPDGGIIAITAAREGDTIAIQVADTGEGMAPEHLERIFERFYRVDDARSRSSGGAGLGLALVREMVELMGGTVKVESAPGEGTVFTVRLRVSLPS
jgi:signal transduction histidine kinase